MIWAALAAFVVGVYVVIVLGTGALLGAPESRPNVLLSVVATCVVAVAFEPVRTRVTVLARRLVHSERVTPYEALSRLSGQAADAYAVDEVLPRMVRVIADGTGAQAAEVWLTVGSRLRCAARWPDDAEDSTRLTSTGSGELLAEPPAAAVVAVRHSGDLLGALVVRKKGQDPLTPVERTLVTALARQAGLVLRNAALTAELAERLRTISAQSKELAASRARLVAAQDAERRRLERDIHDGAQQHLVALAVNLRLVKTLVERSPERALPVLRSLRAAVAKAEETVQDLARGVYPRALSDRGLVPALAGSTSAVAVPVTVSGSPRRYGDEVEAAAYFCCLEAVQNAVKHAAARSVTVEVAGDDDALRFTVSDDGVGFDPSRTHRGAGLDNMADRLETLGGTLTVSSAPGSGTTVSGCIPAGSTRSGSGDTATVSTSEPEPASR